MRQYNNGKFVHSSKVGGGEILCFVIKHCIEQRKPEIREIKVKEFLILKQII